MTWFNGTGAFSEEELKEFIENYGQFGNNNWNTEIDLGDSVDKSVQRLVNDLTKRMGGLQDRLALTIIGLNKRKPKQHSGDCTIYTSLINDTPEAGVCTCGYGLNLMRETGDYEELYSKELKEKLLCVGGGI